MAVYVRLSYRRAVSGWGIRSTGRHSRRRGAVHVFVRLAARNGEAIALSHSVGFDVLDHVQLQVDR